MISRRVMMILVATGCVLPLATVVELAAGRLLSAMQDEVGAAALDRIALGTGIAWALALLCLLLALGINSLGPPPSDASR